MLTSIESTLLESTMASTRERLSIAASTRSGAPLMSSMPDMSADRMVVEYRFTSSGPFDDRLPKPCSRSSRTVWFASASRTSSVFRSVCSSSGFSCPRWAPC